MGRARCAPVPVDRGGELPGSHVGGGPGGHGDVLRGSRGEAAGIELGSSFVERITVNAGTALVLPACRVANTGCRVGAGRSRRSTSSRGKPVHMGKGGSGCEKERVL